MVRVAVVAVAIALASAPAFADAIDVRIAELGDGDNYKLRLASALALSKSTDARALRALISVLGRAGEKSLRRIAVVGLGKQAVSAPAALRAEILEALRLAARVDRDAKVRSGAAKAAKRLAALPAPAPVPVPVAVAVVRPPAGASSSSGSKAAPALKMFIKVDGATDATKRLGADALAHVTKVVRRSVSKAGFSTSWPGALPTSADLRASSAHAYLVAATVKKLEVKKPSRGAEISCTVSIMVAPWHGTDGKELWEAERAATAAGSARAETGGSERDISGGILDCVETVAEEVAQRHVAPFLRRMSER